MNGLGWRMLRREWRAGELRLLALALCIAVAAVTAVGFLTDRLGRSLESGAQQLLGGDLVLAADQPIDPAFVDAARQRGLRLAHSQVFPSMVLAGGKAQLVEIKAVSDAYPLHGELVVAERPGEPGQSLNHGPARGRVWGDERLYAALVLAPGQLLSVGNSPLPASGLLLREPDRSLNLFAVAPRLLMHLDDVAGSGLIQPGARVRYRLLLAGSPQALADWRAWAEPRLARGQRLEDIANARPEVRQALDRAQRFLGLASVLTVILAAIAVALAARRYLQRHLDTCAILRCLGATQGRLLGLHGQFFLGLTGLAALVGCGLGFAAHFVLVHVLQEVAGNALPAPGWTPLLEGGAVAALLLFGFVVPPLLQLARAPTLRVLRRELGPPAGWTLAGYALGFLLLAGLIFRTAGDPRLGGLAIAGFSLALGGFWALARLAILLAGRWRARHGFAGRLGVASLVRHGPANALKIVALGIGLMAILLLGVTRLELVRAWEASLPADAPNRFVINIQPEQRAAVADWLAGQGIAAELAPMVRARLLQINGQPVSAANFPEDDRAQRLVEREFNLSWRSTLPEGNRLTAGRWFAEAGRGEASVEAGLARTLGIGLGDRLQFAVAGVEHALTVTSLRRLDWDSMRVNFFVLTPPGVLEAAPASYITSFHLPSGQPQLGLHLVEAFPNLTVIDIDAVLAQIQGIVGQVVLAVQFVFLFTLLAGGVVLYAAFLSAIDERRYELAVMRALGAARPQLRRAMRVELAWIGGLAGLIAAGGAAVFGQVLARQVFELSPEVQWSTPLLVAVGCALAMALFGDHGLRRLLGSSPMQALRDGQ